MARSVLRPLSSPFSEAIYLFNNLFIFLWFWLSAPSLFLSYILSYLVLSPLYGGACVTHVCALSYYSRPLIALPIDTAVKLM